MALEWKEQRSSAPSQSKFLGASGFYGFWICKFTIECHLYDALSGKDSDTFWLEPRKKTFNDIKRPFQWSQLWEFQFLLEINLFVDKQQHVASKMLRFVIPVSTWWSHLWKHLDPNVNPCPPWLFSLPAAVLVIKKNKKLILGQGLTVQIPHAVADLLNNHRNCWFSQQPSFFPLLTKDLFPFFHFFLSLLPPLLPFNFNIFILYPNIYHTFWFLFTLLLLMQEKYVCLLYVT